MIEKIIFLAWHDQNQHVRKCATSGKLKNSYLGPDLLCTSHNCRQILQKFNILEFLFHQNHKTFMTSMNMLIVLQQSAINTGNCLYEAG